MMQRSDERALSYGRYEGKGKLGKSGERLKSIERSGPYTIRDEIKSQWIK